MAHIDAEVLAGEVLCYVSVLMESDEEDEVRMPGRARRV